MNNILCLLIFVFVTNSQNHAYFQPNSLIYFGKYYLENEQSLWDLEYTEPREYFTFSNGSLRYRFNYVACERNDRKVKICSTDDKNVWITFFDLKQIITCEGNRELHFNKIKVDLGRSEDTGIIQCKD